jgi:phenylalanine-4-hydroxylase
METTSVADLQRHPAPLGAQPDWTIPQRWSDYSKAEHAIWNRLFTRQLTQLQHRAVPAFLAGVKALDMGPTGIPRFEELNEELNRLTGWSVVAVPGLVPEEVFFHHLAHRQFVAGRFIRTAAQLDYLEEPDVFHDVFGHVPLLADPVYASYMQAYGEAGSRLPDGSAALTELARLYWYTVEFGLIRDGDRLRLFGAGIVSSNGESEYALDSPEPLRIGFDLKRTMLTDYRIDSFQKNYFVIDSFEDLVRRTSVDFAGIYKELEGIAPIAVGTRLPTDILFSPNPKP